MEALAKSYERKKRTISLLFLYFPGGNTSTDVDL